MDKELLQLQNRFRDLAEKTYMQNVYTFSSFLSISQQDAFLQIAKELGGVAWELFGGNADCERKMLRFGCFNDLGYEEPYPIVCIHISPLLKKFSDDFSHRDFLGALMNLGIERSTLGDIFIKDKEAYLFCQDNIADYICDNLDKVKHSNVRCKRVEPGDKLPLCEPESVEITVNSQRADSIIAKIYHLSREKSQQLFSEKKVYIDGKMTENLSRILKSGELVTVRGFGRFYYRGLKYETKKGKLDVQADVYR